MRQVLIYTLVAVVVVGGIVYAAPHRADGSQGPPGFDDLEPCAVLTSLDSTRSLRLSRDHRVDFSDSSGLSTRTATGTWSLVDDERHLYRITIDDKAQDYTVASPPAGEGCILAAGRPGAADLGKSWFSAMTDGE